VITLLSQKLLTVVYGEEEMGYLVSDFPKTLYVKLGFSLCLWCYLVETDPEVERNYSVYIRDFLKRK
jgi:hypothetical protein